MSDLPEDQDETLPEEGDDEPHSKPEDWMMPARADGNSWGDIADHVASSTTSALADGHTQEDVDKYLGYSNNDLAHDWMRQNWDQHFASNPPGDKADLTATGTLRDDYARALTENGVKDAKDFADTYASAALTAAEGRQDQPSSQEELERKLRNHAAAADALGSSLPDRHDFIDAAMGYADTPDDQERVRKDLIDQWRKTGIPPGKLVQEHPELLNQHAPSDDPGFALREVLGLGKSVANAWDGLLGLPNLIGKAGDQIWDATIGGDGGAGWVTRNTDWHLGLGDKFQNGVNLIDKLLGGTGNVNLKPYGTFDEHLQDIAGNIMALGPAGLGVKAATTIAGMTELTKGYNAVRPVEDQSPLETLAVNVLAGVAAHVAAGGAIRAFSPSETGEAIRPIGPEEYTRDPLAHMEAIENRERP